MAVRPPRMVETYDYYGALSIATSTLALCVALFVLRRHPGRRAGRTFVLAMSFFLLAALFAYFQRMGFVEGWNPTGLIWVSRGFYFVHMLAVGLAAAFVGMYFYGFAMFRRRSVAAVLYFSLGAAAMFVSALVSIGPSPYGSVRVDTLWSTRSLFAISLFYGLTMVAAIVRTLLRNRDGVVRRQAYVMLGGILVHGAGAGTYGYLRLLREFPPPFLTITALGMAVTFAVAVLRFRMFEVTPRPEEAAPVPRKFEAKAGRAYLVRERKPDFAFRALAEATRRGANGLVVTRAPPDSIREDFDLETTPILWLTETAGRNHVPPTDPDLLGRLVEQFAGRASSPVVAVEGLEYMASYGGFDRVLRTVHQVRDAVTARHGTFLLSVNPGAFDEREVSLLDREFERLEPPVESAVEDVFVIHRSGLLVAHEGRRLTPATDHDIMVSMLTAIMNFVRHSFAEGSDELRRLELGEKSVLIERGDELIVAVVFRGREPPDVDEEMRAFLWRAQRKFGTVLDRWSGDTQEVHGIQAMTARLFL